MEKTQNKITHLAVIMDGNRRYAKSRGLQFWKGHTEGADKLEKFLEWCKEKDIKEVTIYALSIENLKRSQEELDHLFHLCEKWFKKLKKDKRVHQDKIKIKFIGDLLLVPAEIRELAREIEEDTKSYQNYTVNFCFAYGGRQELIYAMNKLKDKSGPITEKDFTNALKLPSEPQLIIRTGNRYRTSNFLPWQSIYSEWIFLEKTWPEITKQDLEEAIQEFKSRNRNFGK